jgi:hypothetical protein
LRARPDGIADGDFADCGFPDLQHWLPSDPNVTARVLRERFGSAAAGICQEADDSMIML